ncbi:hypothetical protein Prudu_012697 [Prunus dulcis]|uniref:Uncharacterized protein n=1 Tax=Prunus dulcis TaxID=3755 RepID=A0A4Y1RD86_PRUDU|nr:hypothetical protein Prudu_012697 [Prunus dulcis]
MHKENIVSPIKLMIAEEEKFQGKALSLSHTKTAISTIKEKFSQQQLRRFEESCFGHLLLIEDLKWTSPIVHGLLLRKADPKTVSNEKHVHIDMRYLKLAKDLEEFVKCPWGAVSYAKTNASLLRALCADYQRVKVPKKAAKTKKSERNQRQRQLIWLMRYFQHWLHYIWRCTNIMPISFVYYIGARFHELMSQVFENCEVDVKLLRPSVIDKQQSYWTWGDSVDDTEELVELFGDDAEQRTITSTSVEEKGENIDETARRSVEDFGQTLASMERYFKLEIEQLKKRSCGLNEGGEGHEEIDSPHMNEGGDNDLSPLHDYVSPPTESAAMETQVPGDGAEPSATMVVEEAEMAASVPHLQVHEATEQEQSRNLPTLEDCAECDKIYQKLLFLLEDWKITDSMPSEVRRILQVYPKKKRPSQTLLSPFTDPLRKKRTMSVSDATATSPSFDPSKPLPIKDVKACGGAIGIMFSGR